MEILRASQSQDIHRIKAIVITESLIDSTFQFSRNLEQIVNIFGRLPALGTKANLVANREEL
jgi:hypothetical protein